jgi:hypothetical protein
MSKRSLAKGSYNADGASSRKPRRRGIAGYSKKIVSIGLACALITSPVSNPDDAWGAGDSDDVIVGDDPNNKNNSDTSSSDTTDTTTETTQGSEAESSATESSSSQLTTNTSTKALTTLTASSASSATSSLISTYSDTDTTTEETTVTHNFPTDLERSSYIELGGYQEQDTTGVYSKAGTYSEPFEVWEGTYLSFICSKDHEHNVQIVNPDSSFSIETQGKAGDRYVARIKADSSIDTTKDSMALVTCGDSSEAAYLKITDTDMFKGQRRAMRFHFIQNEGVEHIIFAISDRKLYTRSSAGKVFTEWLVPNSTTQTSMVVPFEVAQSIGKNTAYSGTHLMVSQEQGYLLTKFRLYYTYVMRDGTTETTPTYIALSTAANTTQYSPLQSYNTMGLHDNTSEKNTREMDFYIDAATTKVETGVEVEVSSSADTVESGTAVLSNIMPGDILSYTVKVKPQQVTVESYNGRAGQVGYSSALVISKNGQTLSIAPIKSTDTTTNIDTYTFTYTVTREDCANVLGSVEGNNQFNLDFKVTETYTATIPATSSSSHNAVTTTTVDTVSAGRTVEEPATVTYTPVASNAKLDTSAITKPLTPVDAGNSQYNSENKYLKGDTITITSPEVGQMVKDVANNCVWVFKNITDADASGTVRTKGETLTSTGLPLTLNANWTYATLSVSQAGAKFTGYPLTTAPTSSINDAQNNAVTTNSTVTYSYSKDGQTITASDLVNAGMYGVTATWNALDENNAATTVEATSTIEIEKAESGLQVATGSGPSDDILNTKYTGVAPEEPSFTFTGLGQDTNPTGVTYQFSIDGGTTKEDWSAIKDRMVDKGEYEIQVWAQGDNYETHKVTTYTRAVSAADAGDVKLSDVSKDELERSVIYGSSPVLGSNENTPAFTGALGADPGTTIKYQLVDSNGNVIGKDDNTVADDTWLDWADVQDIIAAADTGTYSLNAQLINDNYVDSPFVINDAASIEIESQPFTAENQTGTIVNPNAENSEYTWADDGSLTKNGTTVIDKDGNVLDSSLLPSGPAVILPPEVEYTGGSQTPTPIIIDKDGNVLTSPDDFQITYTDSNGGTDTTNVGIVNMTITPGTNGNYTFDDFNKANADSLTFTIEPATGPTSSNFVDANDANSGNNGYATKPTSPVEYTGSGFDANPTIVDDNGNTLVKGTDYTLTYVNKDTGEAVENPTEPGNYTVTVTYTGNYTGEDATFDFEITKASMDGATVLTTSSDHSDESCQGYCFDDDGNLYKDGHIVVTGEGVVENRDLLPSGGTNNVLIASNEVTYTGEEVRPHVVVVDKNGNLLEEGSDYKITYIGPDGTVYEDSDGVVKTGNYTMTITYLEPHYDGKTENIAFTVTDDPNGQMHLSLASSKALEECTYGEAAPEEPVFTGNMTTAENYSKKYQLLAEGDEPEENSTWYTWKEIQALIESSDAGTYSLYVQGTADGYGTKEFGAFSVTIKPEEFPDTTTVADTSSSDAASNQGYSWDADGNLLKDGTKVVDAKGNALDSNGDAIDGNKSSLTGPAVILPANPEYTGSAVTPTPVIIDKDGNVLKSPDDFKVEYYDGDTLVENPTDAGTYTIKIVSGDSNNNYNFDELNKKDLTFTIEQQAGPTSAPVTPDSSTAQAANTIAATTSVTYNGDSLADTLAPTITDAQGTTMSEGADYTLTYEKKNDDGTWTTVKADEVKDVGTYRVTVNYGAGTSGNYSGTTSYEVTVAPSTAAIDPADITMNDTTYSGDAQQPVPTIIDDNGRTLIAGVDFDVQYRDSNKNLTDSVVEGGEYTAVITYKGNYAGTYPSEVTFNVNPAADGTLDMTDEARKAFANMTYGDDSVEEPKLSGTLAADDKTTITYQLTDTSGNPIDGGGYLSWDELQEKLAELPAGDYKINVKASNPNLGTADLSPAISLTVDKQNLGDISAVTDPTDPSTSASSQLTYDASGNVVDAAGNTVFNADGTLADGATAPAGPAVIMPTDTTYDGSTQKPTPIIVDRNGNKLVEGTDYMLEYQDAAGNVVTNPTDAGEYKVVVKPVADSNYDVSGLEIPYTISPAQGALNIVEPADESWKTQTYSGKAMENAPAMTFTGVDANGDGTADTLDENDITQKYSIDGGKTWLDWNQVAEQMKGAGTYDLLIQAEGPNYAAQQFGPYTVTVNPRAVENQTVNDKNDSSTTPDAEGSTGANTVTSEKSATFTGSPHNATPVVTSDTGEVLSEGTDYTLTYKDSKGNVVDNVVNAGDYTVEVNYIGNYSGTTVFPYSVAKASAPVVSVSSSSKSTLSNVTVGSTIAEPVIETTAQGESTNLYSLNGESGPWLTWAQAAAAMSAEGAYQVWVKSSNPNYEDAISAPVTVKVNAKASATGTTSSSSSSSKVTTSSKKSTSSKKKTSSSSSSSSSGSSSSSSSGSSTGSGSAASASASSTSDATEVGTTATTGLGDTADAVAGDVLTTSTYDTGSSTLNDAVNRVFGITEGLRLTTAGAVQREVVDQQMGGMIQTWNELDEYGMVVGSYVTADWFGNELLLSDMNGKVLWMYPLIMAGIALTAGWWFFLVARRREEDEEK